MENKQGLTGRKIFVLFPVVLALTVFMILAMSMRAAARNESYSENGSSDGEGFVYTVLPNAKIIRTKQGSGSIPEEANISGLNYNIQTHTVTLSGANVEGTLQFNSIQDQVNNKLIATSYTVVLAPGTKSKMYALKLMDGVVVTIKGEGELVVEAPQKNTDYGAALTFHDSFQTAPPKLIIEGGTVTVDSTYHGFTLKEAGCLYIKDGARSVTIIGKTDNGEQVSVIPSKSKLQGNESIPRIFSDYPCKAQYVRSINNGQVVDLSANGTKNGTSDKTISDASLLRDDQDTFYKLVFKPGYTVTWQDYNGTVLLKDKSRYYAGETPRYDGGTPTRAADSQYTYTFAGWSPTPSGIYADTTYTAVYTKNAIVTIAKTLKITKTKVNKGKVTLTWKTVKKSKKTKKTTSKSKKTKSSKKKQRIQVQYSTDKTFTTNVHNKWFRYNKKSGKLKLKRKRTYYIRMRYVKNGRVSAWSKVKVVKTK